MSFLFSLKSIRRSTGPVLLAALGLVAAGVVGHRLTVQAQEKPLPPLPPLTALKTTKPLAREVYKTQIAPLVQKYCHSCHGPKKQNADLALHKYPDEASVLKDSKTWEAVLEMIEFKAMPPEDKPQPTEAERKLLVDWLNDRLFHFDCNSEPDPGRVTIRRLNRAEYNNTVRDLLGVDIDPAKDFPSDDVGEGFDNIGDVLSLPPLLLEKYVEAAERIADATIRVEGPAKSDRQHFEREGLRTSGGAERSRGGIYGIHSNGAVTARAEFRRDGEYLLRVRAGAQQAGTEVAKMELRLDGKLIETVEVKASRDAMQVYEKRLRVTKGSKDFAAAFINDYYNEKAADPKDRDRNLYINFLEVLGPLDVQADELPASHTRIVTTKPSRDLSANEAAKTCLRPLVNRAFRRRATEEEIDRLAGLVELAVKQGDSFERGLQVALTGVLVSPHFLFRVERDAKPHDPAAVHELAQYELASRLSYFLWSSMPDDELFALATKGQLSDNAVLDQQVRRMLKDPKSKALVENFGGQWLNLRMLDEIGTNNKQFPTFNRRLKDDMRRETELFFESVVREDRSILDFLDGGFTFVNQRLAEHYGLPGVSGDEFRRVDLKDGRRAGVLTHASILTLTSNPTRTSPVKRGKWIMENILGTPPPDPPPDVPELDSTQKAAPNASLREQMELHRKDPGCASCHRQMDALGFGFENFDAIGRWRDKDGKLDIDSSGTLPGGAMFQGPADLVKILKQRKVDFGRSLSSKLLIYALGRGLQPYDRCAIDDIVKKLQKDDRFSTLVIAIVHSDPFGKRRGEGEKP